MILGGGNAKLLKDLPKGAELGSNATAFAGRISPLEEPAEGSKRLASDTWHEVRRSVISYS